MRKKSPLFDFFLLNLPPERINHKAAMAKMIYPIGIQNFESLRDDGYVYVDKTALVYELANTGRYYFLSRPRRFGKSLLLSTLDAYLSGKRELFKGLAIERLEEKWTKYPVIHLDLNVGQYQDVDSLNDKLDSFLRPLEAEFGRDPVLKEAGQRFEYVIKAAYRKLGQRLVILVDEYDKPLLAAIENEGLQDQYRTILKAFYGALKSTDQCIRFALLTGVTKFGKMSVFSDLNNITDISMDARYQTICGITDSEIDRYFRAAIENVARNSGVSAEQARQMIRDNYDGYHFRQNGVNIYNPYSLLNCFDTGEVESYWFATGTPTFLVKLLQKDHFRLPDLTTSEVTADTLNSIDSMDRSPLPIIYQSGYLTIKGYDTRFKTYTLGFPNKEVEEGFTMFLLPFYTNIQKDEARDFIGNFVKDLRTGHPDNFMRRMATMLADTSYKVVGDAELYFQNAFYLITKMLGFYTQVERTFSSGRMDMVIETEDYVYIIEFKYDQSADTALKQIDDKEYAKPYAMDRRTLIKIGVNFSMKKRCIDGWEVER